VPNANFSGEQFGPACHYGEFFHVAFSTDGSRLASGGADTAVRIWDAITRPYRAHDDLRPHFGLGDATNAETVRVEWPSGQVTELHNVASKQILTIREPARLQLAGQSAGAFQLALTAHPGMSHDVYSSTHLHQRNDAPCSSNCWQLWRCVTNTSRTITLTDTNCACFSQRFYRAKPR
jgi:hypothetical protein